MNATIRDAKVGFEDPLRSVKIFGVFQIYCMLRITILTKFRIFGLFWNISL